MSSNGNKLFVGNLAWTTNTGSLQSAFGQFGQVVDAIVMQDRETGRSRGFGFITFSQPTEAEAAIAALNDSEIDGRQVRVNYANSQTGGGGGGFRQGGGGGYRGGAGNYTGNGYGGGGGGYSNQPRQAYTGGYSGPPDQNQGWGGVHGDNTGAAW